MNVIELSEVWLSYRPRGDRGQRQAAVWALRDVSLAVAAGECVAIMGPNGSGKSTTLRVAAGIFEPTRGRVLRARQTSCVLDLTVGQNRELSGLQALEVYAAVDGKTGAQWRAMRSRVIDATQLEPTVLERALSTYSLGMLLRLQLALALCEGSDALVLDEVLAAADDAYRTSAIEQIRQLALSGAAVLLASHDASLVRSLAQRIIVIEHGVVSFDGPVAAGLRAYAARQVTA